MSEQTIEKFDVIAFLDDLIREMDMANANPVQLYELKEQMAEALHNAIFYAASQNMEPEVIDSVMEELRDESDPWFIITELVQRSPGAQLAMVKAIESFHDNTLEAYNQLK